MRVMVIVKATKQAEDAEHPFDVDGAAEMFEAMGKYNEELVKAGILLAGDGLKPSRFGKRVQFNGTARSVTDGPFAETREGPGIAAPESELRARIAKGAE
jgi:hypothetical protein